MTTPNPPPVTGLLRWLYIGLGLGFVGLAGLGVILPGVPATPFVLLASYFLVRSSPALHGWLMRSRLFGGLLRDWEQHRGVRRPVKFLAYLLIPMVVTLSVIFSALSLWVKGVIILLAGIGLVVVYRLPTVPADGASDRVNA